MGSKVRVLSVVAVLMVACDSADVGPPAPPFTPVADVKQIMEMVVDPAAEVVWESVGFIITADGEEKVLPRNDEEWAVVRNSAMILAESGNLLMIGDRAKGEGPWMIMSRSLVEAGKATLQAAEAKDAEAIFAVGERLYNACETCHVLYWYDEDGLAIRDVVDQ
jgi:hypothetical protein